MNGGTLTTEPAKGDRLLERDAELEALKQALGQARAGSGTVVLIEGAGGMGKSSLLLAAADLAQVHGFRVLGARASQLEHEFAFGVARQLFERTLKEAPEAERQELLAGAAGLAATAFSELPDATLPTSPDGYAALHGLYWLCSNLSEASPLLLAVDDLQWADSPSLRYLTMLASRLDDLPVAIVATIRPGEGTEHEAPFVELSSLANTTTLAPSPLSPQAVRTLVERGLGEAEEPFVEACHHAVAGNPFLLTQLIALLRDQGVAADADHSPAVSAIGARSVSRAMLARIASVAHSSGRLATAIAVLGDGAELRHAAALADLDVEEAAAAADALVRAELLNPGEHLTFVHPIVRSAVYEDVGVHERALKHRRAAWLLAAEEAAAERVAAHLLLTHPAGDARAVTLLRRAAEIATGRGQPSIAALYLERAHREPPAADLQVVLRELGEAELMSGEPSAFGHLRDARAASGDPVERALLALGLARALTMVHGFPEAQAVLEQSLHETAGMSQELTLTLEAEHSGVLFNTSSDRKGAPGFAEVAQGLTGKSPAERLALMVCTMRAMRGGTAREIDRIGRLALGGGQLLADQPPGSPALIYVIGNLIYADVFDVADDEAGRLLELSRRQGSPVGAALASAAIAISAFRQGDLPRAEEHGRDCVEPCRRSGAESALALALSAEVDALIERGQSTEALQELQRDGYDAGPLPVSAPFDWLLLSRSRLRRSCGDLNGALDDALEVGSRAIAADLDNPACTPWRSEAALAHLGMGSPEKALPLVTAELVLATTFGAPRSLGIALRVRGLCEPGEQGVQTLQQAVRVLEASSARLEHARALTDLGASLRRTQRRSDAQIVLREALDLAVRHGAVVLAERAGDELRATGARPRRPAMTGLDALTASERRVGKLAASGLMNREIAQSLFVTLGTVEMHLTRAYRKLGVSSRAELVGILAGATTQP